MGELSESNTLADPDVIQFYRDAISSDARRSAKDSNHGNLKCTLPQPLEDISHAAPHHIKLQALQEIDLEGAEASRAAFSKRKDQIACSAPKVLGKDQWSRTTRSSKRAPPTPLAPGQKRYCVGKSSE